jgi:hypothetical protein
MLNKASVLQMEDGCYRSQVTICGLYNLTSERISKCTQNLQRDLSLSTSGCRTWANAALNRQSLECDVAKSTYVQVYVNLYSAFLALLFFFFFFFFSSSYSSICGAGGNPAYRTSAFEAVCTLTPVLVPPFISRGAPRQTA